MWSFHKATSGIVRVVIDGLGVTHECLAFDLCQVSAPTSVTCVRRRSRRDAPSSPTAGRCTAWTTRTPTSRDARSCTCVRTAATPPRTPRGTTCTSRRSTLTAPRSSSAMIRDSSSSPMIGPHQISLRRVIWPEHVTRARGLECNISEWKLSLHEKKTVVCYFARYFVRMIMKVEMK